jgi:hypothetical protein
VDTNRGLTSGANPLGLLAVNKAPQSTGLDASQILNHAHAVLRAITLIKMAESFTWELRTAGTEIAIVSASRFAIPDFAGNARLAALLSSATGATIPSA